MGKGRPQTTGRFDSRSALCEWVWRVYLFTPANVADIAVQCRVSEGVIQKIISNNEGHPVLHPKA